MGTTCTNSPAGFVVFPHPGVALTSPSFAKIVAGHGNGCMPHSSVGHGGSVQPQLGELGAVSLAASGLLAYIIGPHRRVVPHVVKNLMQGQNGPHGNRDDANAQEYPQYRGKGGN